MSRLLQRRAARLTLFVFVLSGCATLTPAQRGLGQLNTEQRARYAADHEAAQRVCVQFKQAPCRPANMTVASERRLGPGTLGMVDERTGHVLILAALYDDEHEWLRHVILAHEWSHIILGHSRSHVQGPCYMRGAGCEMDADQHAVDVLTYGWGYARAEAIHAVYRKLLREITRPAGGGHASGCVEISTFASTFGLPTPSECAPRPGGHSQGMRSELAQACQS